MYLLDGHETARLIFRKIQESDFAQWLEFFKDPRTSVHWIEEKESPERECTKWYEKQLGRYLNDLGGMNALIEKQSGKLIGHAGLLIQTVDETQELEIAYSLLPNFWNKGYASEAAKFCRDFAFENNLTESIISIISETNVPSAKVAINNGMRLDRKTFYKKNRVNIFRITKKEWQAIATPR